jgi:iron complex outermembrane recepter protein
MRKIVSNHAPSGVRGMLLATAALAIISVPAAASAAQAATDDQPISQKTTDAAAVAGQSALSDNEIIVTGSRIARAKVTAQPAEVLGAEQISKRGYTNLGNALQELPAFSVPSNSPIGAQGSFSAGQSFVNLYNLGSQRTLSLVNGHRFVTSASSSIFSPVAGSPVDFSSIPADLVEKIEVVSVGGAPIYGSDAIAGTVNTILKKNFEGLQVNGQTGVSQRGDGENYNVSALVGKNFAEGRGNITLNVSYDRQRGIPTSDRYFTSADSPFTTTALAGRSYATQLFNGGQRYNVFTNTGMPMVDDNVPIYGGQVFGSIVNAQGEPLYFDNNGRLAVFHNGELTGSKQIQAGGDGFRLRDYDNFLTDTKRIQGTALAHYDFSDHFRFSGEAWLGRSIGRNLRAQPYYNTALFGDAGDVNGNLVMSTSNPYLSAQDRATIISNLTDNGLDPSTFYLTRANTDLATGAFTTRTDLYRFVGTFSGDFSVGDHPFNWEVTANYGHTKATTKSRELVVQNFFNALNATTDASGNIVCAPGYTNAAIGTISSTCAPLDVFGVNQASRAAQDYITSIAKTTQTNSQLDIVADINGSIVKLPGGDVKFSLGYEHRRESTSFNPGAFFFGEDNGDGTRSQYGNSIPIDPVSGAYHTDEAFGELDIPLVSSDMNVPLVRMLNLQAAGRYVHNSLTGGFWTYTGGGTYSPIQDITFRGNYTRSFRAPAISEAFAPAGQVFDTANDPCDQRYITGGPNPSRRAANCAAAGITQPFDSDVANFTAQGTFGGNPNLQNETANSWTAGAVIEPRFLRGFKLSADYISIDVKNEIASLNLTDLMNACYDATDFPGNSFCSTFTRDADHQVTSFAEGNYNIGVEHFRALQVEFDYRFKLSNLGLPEKAGALGLNVNYLHTFSHYTKIGEGDKTYSVGTVGEPTDNVTANLNYNVGRFNILWQTMFFGKSKVNVNVPSTNYEYPNAPHYFMFNTSIGYDISDHYNVRLIVNNVFDKGVPFPYVSGYNAQTRYYDAIMGRYFKVNFGIKL